MAVDLIPLWEGFEYKEHQVTAVNWMLKREREADQDKLGGLLCDEMGLGKTMEVLGVVKNNPKPLTLLLCPKAVITQWQKAAIQSRLNVVMYDKKGVWSKPYPFFPGQPFFYISNYEKVSGHTYLFSQRWSRIVLDEAHKIRNRSSILYRAIQPLNRKITWCVTATPVVNDLVDIRNLYGLVGYDVKELTNYSNLINATREACLHRSMEEMRPFLPELPAAADIKKEVLDFLTEDEAEFYRGIQGGIMRRWRALEKDNVKAVFELLMRLRQLSVHPQVYINSHRKNDYFPYERPDWEDSSTKFSVLRQKIEGEEPKKWIVFCQFHDEMEILDSYLSRSGSISRILKYHGKMTDDEKEETILQSHEEVEGHDILLLQLQSGAVGLNLQHYTRIIFMSPWWNSAVLEQAIGRAVRIGQKERVEVTMLLLKEEQTMNIDEKMLEKVEEKKSMLSRLFQYASRGFEQDQNLDFEAEEHYDVEEEERIPVAVAAGGGAADPVILPFEDEVEDEGEDPC